MEILLVTSRSGRRWLIPKGWPMPGRKPHGTARREALEEAGLVGRISKRALGSFSYRKKARAGRHITCEVLVFALRVQRQRRHWREKKEREFRWLPVQEAADTVDEPELKRLIKRFSTLSEPLEV